MTMRMHAIVFEAATIHTQSDLPGVLLRSPILPFVFVSGQSSGSPESSTRHQMISVAPIFSLQPHHQHLLNP